MEKKPGRIRGKTQAAQAYGVEKMTEPWVLEQLRQDRWDKILARRPRCCLCLEPILQDEALVLAEKYYCDRCLDRHRQEVEPE